MEDSRDTAQRFGRWPAPSVNRNVGLISHNVLVPGETVNLSPFAQVRSRGLTDHVAKSAVRSLDIIELLARENRSMRAVEIASTLALSASSTHQVLKSLVDAAYLVFDAETKTYARSGRLALAAFQSEPRRHYMDAVRQTVADVHRDFRTTLTLASRQSEYMQVVAVFEHVEDCATLPNGRNDLRMAAIGLRIPIFGSSTGAAWLAAQPDDAALKAAKRCKRALGAMADSPQELLRIAAHVRAQGHAEGGISSDDGIRAVAVALPPNPDGHVHVLGAIARTSEAESCQLLATAMKTAIARRF